MLFERLAWTWAVACSFAVTACDGCTRSAPPAPSGRGSQRADAGGARAGTRPAQQLTWVYPNSAVGPMHVLVLVPAHDPASGPLPVLIAFHGRGESKKGPELGARGWVDDYDLLQAVDRLHAPPLTRADFKGHVRAERLALINRELVAKPYRGAIVLCPYTPDILAGKRAFSAAEPLATFVVDELLPRVRRELPAASGAAQVGIDGVSLGGRAALLVGFARPSAFGAVASLQAAFDDAEASELAERASEAVRANPTLVVRLLTSEGDYFLSTNRTLSSALSGRDVPHQLLVVAGPHDYEFNQGPGAFEMLLFHDRVLRAERPIP